MNSNTNTPAWDAFLDAAFEGDAHDIQRLQLVLQEAVHHVTETPPVVLIWSEDQKAGKSTLVRALRKALADSTTITFVDELAEQEVTRVVDQSLSSAVRPLHARASAPRPAFPVVAALSVPVIDVPEGPRIHDFEVIGNPNFVLGDLDAELDLIREWATGIPAEHRAA